MTDLPTVILGGQQYPVKPLVLKQLRIVEPAWARLRHNNGITTEQQMDDLIEIVYQAVAPAQTPPLTRDAFTSLPISTSDLVAALPVIAQQAGMTGKAGATGEAQSTGMPS